MPLNHELVLDLSRINRLRAVETTRRRATAEPGVLTGDLLTAVTPAGLFYPPDPSSFKVSSLGGNVAENAGGPRGLKYGVTQDYVQALEVVLLDGEVLSLRREEDWDVLALFIGSEGTLGAITLVEVRLIPTPPARRALLAVFPRLADATRTVSIILREGITPALIELMDDIAIRCVEAYRGLGLPLDVEAILLIETDGDEREADRDAARVRDLCVAAGAREVRLAATADEAEALWTARRSITGALGRVRPDKIGEDICVPRPAIPTMARRVKEIGQEYGVPVVLFGHAGDGNLHPNVLFSSLDADERRRGRSGRGRHYRGRHRAWWCDLRGARRGYYEAKVHALERRPRHDGVDARVQAGRGPERTAESRQAAGVEWLSRPLPCTCNCCGNNPDPSFPRTRKSGH